MKTYNAAQVKELIARAIDDADRELWTKMKAKPNDSYDVVSAANALESVHNQLLRLMDGLDD